MRKRLIIGSVAAGLMLVAGPALADGQSGSKEHHTECTQNPDPNGAPICNEVADNDVQCGEAQGTVPAPTGPIVISGTGDPAAGAGELEVCSADSPVLEGRVIVGGSADDRGGYVIADGDTDNGGDPKTQGFARVDVGPGGPTVTCGDPNGDLDGTSPGATDGQDQCG
jgi:hypothetical protein